MARRRAGATFRGPRSERAFHAWLRAGDRPGPGIRLGLGDDAAAVDAPPGRCAVLSTDALVEGTHFLPESRPGEVGKAAVAVSLSDLAAKGAVPAAVLLAILVPPKTPQRWARDVVRGAREAARAAGAALVGGDTKPAPRRAVVGCVLGWADSSLLAPRSGARPGDLLVTTGTVGRGGAAAGLRGGSPGARAAAVARMLAITPRLAEGRWLARRARAMIDTSDGIGEAAHLLAEASRVRVVLDARRLPWDPGLGPARPEDPGWLGQALYGGDYELLAAVPRPSRPIPPRIGRVVGTVAAGRGAWIDLGGRIVPLPRAGWDPFAALGRTSRGARS
ncbi:MAG: thiamine-phosphate kinase [Thermoplasmata archaeon]